jgi:hypothetical protein
VILMFPGRVISLFGDIAPSGRSPDLSAPGYNFYEHLKAKVYANQPRTLEELKEHIRDEIRPTDKGMSQEAMRSF